VDRFSIVQSSVLTAVHGKQEFFQETQVGQNIGIIAKQILSSRRGWLLTKQGMRPLLKYAGERVIEEQLRQTSGELAAGLFNLAGDIFNVLSEKADLRGWQTLPNEIRVSRIFLEPGTYDFFMEDLDRNKILIEKRPLGAFTLKAGEKKFLVTRSYR
jgi:hypothetical protein